jgi:cytoskeleton protein RodZ
MTVPQPAHAPGTLGHTLKSLREARNLSLSDVAARLRLDPRVIAAIEANDFDALPGALYVRGYLRGYARVLGASPDQIVERYNEEAPSVPPQIVPEMSRPPQRTSEDMPVRAASIALAVLLGVLLLLWWQNTYLRAPQPFAGMTATPAPVERTPAPKPQSQLPYSYTVVTHPTATFYRAPDPVEAPDDGATTLVPVAGTSGPAPVPGTGSTGPDRVLLEAATDSWVEVTDRSGERIYMDFIHGGESLTLTGHAPFNVLLGYAPGVTVEFNGRTFDPGPYTRAGVARFDLGR